MSPNNDYPRRTNRQQRRWRPGWEPDRGTTRIEAFSDAVIAIMLTLLAVDLLKFDPAAAREAGLLTTLLRIWPSYLAFGLTFLVVGQIWVTHHNLWRYIARVDQGLCIVNLVLLMFIAITPFAAQVLADSLAALPPSEQSRASSIYSAVMLGQAVTFNVILWWARWQGLLCDRVDDALYRAIALRFLIGPALYASALLLSLISPALGIACYMGVILLYMLPGAGDLPAGRRTPEELS